MNDRMERDVSECLDLLMKVTRAKFGFGAGYCFVSMYMLRRYIIISFLEWRVESCVYMLCILCFTFQHLLYLIRDIIIEDSLHLLAKESWKPALICQ